MEKFVKIYKQNLSNHKNRKIKMRFVNKNTKKFIGCLNLTAATAILGAIDVLAGIGLVALGS